MAGSRVRIRGTGLPGPNAGAQVDPGTAAGAGAENAGSAEKEGIVEDVDSDGALILRVTRGQRSFRERVLAGDVALLDL
jgi:hypothetical protein